MTDILLAGTFIVAAVLAAAALLKLLRWREFRSELNDYGFVPGLLTLPLAVAVPVAEAAAVVAFVNPGTRRAGTTAMLVLLAIFTAALAYTLLSGRREARCACFGRSSRSISWLLPIRNITLAALPLGLLAAGPVATGGPRLSAWVTAALGAVLLWMGLEFASLRSIVRAG